MNNSRILEAFCQYFRQLTNFNLYSTGRMFLVGLSQGPPHHYWYIWLDKLLPKRNLRTVSKINVLKSIWVYTNDPLISINLNHINFFHLKVGLKILADQFLAAPFFAITFVFGMGLLEDKRLSECWHEFVLKFPAIYLVSSSWLRKNYNHSSLVKPIPTHRIFPKGNNFFFISVRLDNMASVSVHKFQIRSCLSTCSLC